MPPRRVVFIFFIILLFLHTYLGVRLLPSVHLSGAAQGLWWCALMLSTVLVPIGLLARHIRLPLLSDVLSAVGLSFLGLFSMFLCLTFLRDLILIACHFIVPDQWPQLRPISGQAVLVLAPLLTLLGAINARRLARVVHVNIAIKDLPAGLNGFTIVQISDIHVGPTIKRDYLQRIVNRVNQQQGDIIAITGDIVDGSVRRLAKHTQVLNQLSARHGVYLVTGNHEYYAGAQEWIAEFRRLGLTVLENTHQIIEHQGSKLLLAGVTDYSAKRFVGGLPSDPHAARANAPDDIALNILLAHQPRSGFAAAKAGFDLQLSGHTHGGQFAPWSCLVPFQQPVIAGLLKIDQLLVYTSRGTGYWGPPMRMLAPSEITVLHLVSETA